MTTFWISMNTWHCDQLINDQSSISLLQTTRSKAVFLFCFSFVCHRFHWPIYDQAVVLAAKMRMKCSNCSQYSVIITTKLRIKYKYPPKNNLITVTWVFVISYFHPCTGQKEENSLVTGSISHLVGKRCRVLSGQSSAS